jgi:hypothetical protein
VANQIERCSLPGHATGRREGWRGPDITPQADRDDITDPADIADSSDSTEKNDPTLNADAKEPIDPTEQAEPTEPMDRTDPRDPIDRKESCDHRDHFDDGFIRLFSTPADHQHTADITVRPSIPPRCEQLERRRVAAKAPVTRVRRGWSRDQRRRPVRQPCLPSTAYRPHRRRNYLARGYAALK